MASKLLRAYLSDLPNYSAPSAVGSSHTVERLLKRAADKAAKDAKKRVQQAGRANMFRGLAQNSGNAFHSAMTEALKRHFNGMKSGQRPSIKMKAPDTGGRPFHFAHSRITANGGGGAKPGRAKKRAGKKGAAAAHMKYIEREGAVEEIVERPEIGDDVELGWDLLSGAIDRDAGLGKREGRERSQAEAAQDYIDDAEKVETAKAATATQPAQPMAFSFGNIGTTPEEREEFWRLLEKRSAKDGRVQSRLIVELPVESTPAQRLEIMHGYAAWFRNKNLPHWIALHAPTDKNDPRNFHAHVIYSDWPARLIPWPLGGLVDLKPGESQAPLVPTWDFAARTFTKEASRVTRDRYLHASNVEKQTRAKDFIPKQRKRFAAIVNAVMAKAGNPVRYDERSYKNMGIDVEPMKSVKKMIEDKVRSGERLRLDTGLTKRILEAELNRVTRERAADFAEVAKVKRAAQASLASLLALEKEAQFLGRRKGLAQLASGTLKRGYRTAALKFAQAKERHVAKQVALAHERLELERLVKATDPDGLKALRENIKSRMIAAVAKDRHGKEAKRLKRELVSLDPHHTAYVHEAARAELGDMVHRHLRISTRTLGAIRGALGAWREVAEGKLPPLLPKYTGAVLEQQAQAAQKAAREPKPYEPPKFYPSSTDEMLDAMFFTPHHRVALAIGRQITEYIMELGAVEVPGKSKADVVREGVHSLVDAFKKGPIEAQVHMATAPEAYRQQAAAATPPPKGAPIRASTAPTDGVLHPLNIVPSCGSEPTISVPAGPNEGMPTIRANTSEEEPPASMPIVEAEALVEETLAEKRKKKRRKAIIANSNPGHSR